MHVDHRRAHIAVAQQLLHRADIRPALQQIRRKRMPQRVRCDFFLRSPPAAPRSADPCPRFWRETPLPLPTLVSFTPYAPGSHTPGKPAARSSWKRIRTRSECSRKRPLHRLPTRPRPPNSFSLIGNRFSICGCHSLCALCVHGGQSRTRRIQGLPSIPKSFSVQAPQEKSEGPKIPVGVGRYF
jgi:hypothetical protein